MDERVHVIALCIVENERKEETLSLPLEVTGITGSTKILLCVEWIMDSVSNRALADTKKYEIAIDINNNTSTTEVEPSLVY